MSQSYPTRQTEDSLGAVHKLRNAIRDEGGGRSFALSKGISLRALEASRRSQIFRKLTKSLYVFYRQPLDKNMLMSLYNILELYCSRWFN